MREILFRGKRTDNDEWIEGCFLDKNNIGIFYDDTEEFDFTVNIFSVIPETVGQYTDLTDKNGKKIFEGDIVKGTFFGLPIPIEDDVFSICWQEDVAGYKANYFENVEVIGNIYDNPELLETDK